MYASTHSLPSYRVAAIQYEPTLGKKEQNVVDLLRLVEEAAQQQARLIVLPEMGTTGCCWLSRSEIAPYVEPIPGPTTARFTELAARYNCYIALGLPEVDPATNLYYNTQVLIGPDGPIGRYRKVHSSISDPRWARDGDLGFPVWDTPLGRLAGVISTDMQFFEAARLEALYQADVLMLSCNWSLDRCPSNWWMTRAFENGVYLVAANRYGFERETQFQGGSCVINPDGTPQSSLFSGNGAVYGEIDLKRCRDKRWRDPQGRLLGDRLADRQPRFYADLASNTYLSEPLRYHALYGANELPPGQLSCLSIVQTELDQMFFQPQSQFVQQIGERVDRLGDLIGSLIHDHEPAHPDVLVLPELILPGYLAPTDPHTSLSPIQIATRLKENAIQVPGPETDRLVELARNLQISMVLGVAERTNDPTPGYYNTILLLDPEGIYGSYRKIHLTEQDKLWAAPGNLGLPCFDTPAGRVGLTTGYDLFFPETLRILASQGADLVCAPSLLDMPKPINIIEPPNPFSSSPKVSMQHLLWQLRASEQQVYLAVANWHGSYAGLSANGNSGIFSPASSTFMASEVVIEDDDEPGLMLMTIDTREQRNGQRSSTMPLNYMPGLVAGSLTGELTYDIRDTIPGNVVRGKPLLRKRQTFWYRDLIHVRK